MSMNETKKDKQELDAVMHQCIFANMPVRV